MKHVIAFILLALLPVSAQADYHPDYTWTGLYVGGDAGVLWNSGRLKDGTDWPSDSAGFLGGGRAGYNLQIGQFVIGVEGEANIAAIDNGKQCALNTHCDIKQDTLGSARLRLGLVPEIRSLVYLQGGVAFSDYRFSVTRPGSSSSGTGAAMGETVGIGLDYAFSDHWSYGAEFSYYDFNKKLGTGTGTLDSFSDEVLVARLGYKF